MIQANRHESDSEIVKISQRNSINMKEDTRNNLKKKTSEINLTHENKFNCSEYTFERGQSLERNTTNFKNPSSLQIT